MSDVNNVLPKLGDKRLALAGKQSHRCRKLTQIMNDKLKRKTTVYQKTVDKECKNFEHKMWKSGIPYKQNVVQCRGTQKYLRHMREKTAFDDESNLFGVYNGVSLDSLQYEIDNVIQKAHPRTRRLKKVERLLDRGKQDGRILDYNQAKAKLEMIIKRPSFPPKKEGNMAFSLRPSSANPTPEFTRHDTLKELRLPPINISRENTSSNFSRMKSRSLPSIFNGRSNTFTVENKLKHRFSIHQ